MSKLNSIKNPLQWPRWEICWPLRSEINSDTHTVKRKRKCQEAVANVKTHWPGFNACFILNIDSQSNVSVNIFYSLWTQFEMFCNHPNELTKIGKITCILSWIKVCTDVWLNSGHKMWCWEGNISAEVTVSVPRFIMHKVCVLDTTGDHTLLGQVHLKWLTFGSVNGMRPSFRGEEIKMVQTDFVCISIQNISFMFHFICL